MSRGTKIIVGSALTLALLIAGGYGLDRWSAHRTETAIADQFSSQGDARGVHAKIYGSLFFPQLIRGSVDQISLTAEKVTIENLDFTEVAVAAHGVSIDEPRTADRLSITGTIPISTLEKLLTASKRAPKNITIKLDGGRLGASMSVLGTDVKLTAEPVVRSGKIQLSVRSLEFGSVRLNVGDLPSGVQDAVGELTVPTSALPKGLTPAAISVRDGGVRLTIAGNHVALDELN